ncbi:MAG: hypothetical protein LUQ65_12715 [Candidatus Helarchaeota archaeon]|nr:hypothetical protein [Candidatus Helarchaeota archaeon]
MTFQRRFAPIGGRFDPESLAGLTGIYMCGNDLSRYIKKILLDQRARSRFYLNGLHLERIIMDHTKGIQNYTSEIHKLLTFELIQRQLIE